ncbi:hypothetical protein COLO4_16272 [Corchorus olitorius]|uniref:PLAC8 motif-containing protein n=1 Tax=Corchorus olitorius TaxID=93759 RepID=A0A1R3JIB9_9ROSI|nr:hypothetical protein COLO4_16272 [Corchorus olitorius]
MSASIYGAARSVDVEPVQVPNSGKWSTGLFDCGEDPSNCFATFCCPFITFGRNVEIIDRGKTSPVEATRTYYLLGMFGCAFCHSFPYRAKLRAQYSLLEEPCGDCLVHWCCIQYALCQEYRELKSRGLDPSKGWAANAVKMNQNGREPPVVEQGMSR